jgi:hypothetical protein
VPTRKCERARAQVEQERIEAKALSHAGELAAVEVAIMSSENPAKVRAVLLGVLGITSIEQISEARPALEWVAAFRSLIRTPRGGEQPSE